MEFLKKVAKDTRVKDRRSKTVLDCTIAQVVVAQPLIQTVQQLITLRDGKHRITVPYQGNSQ